MPQRLQARLHRQNLVITDEERDAFNVHVANFKTGYAPMEGLESELCSQLIDLRWALHQISVDIFNMNALLGEATQKLRAQKATALAPIVKSLSTLNLYDQRRAAADVEQRLLALQNKRIEAAKADLEAAAHAHQLHQARDLPFSPAENGLFRKHFSRSLSFNELQESIRLG